MLEFKFRGSNMLQDIEQMRREIINDNNQDPGLYAGQGIIHTLTIIINREKNRK